MGAPAAHDPAFFGRAAALLLNNISKMKQDTPLGSRIVEVHNGSSLFTGDAGSGESNARRYMIENDLVEAIIALPEKMFYNTGIGTYIWVLSNRKEARRQGKIQLIDATGIKTPLRKNMGEKNCELSPEQRGRSCVSSWILRGARSAASSPTANLAIGRCPCSSRCSTRRATPCSTRRAAFSRTGQGKERYRNHPLWLRGRHRELHGKRGSSLRPQRIH